MTAATVAVSDEAVVAAFDAWREAEGRAGGDAMRAALAAAAPLLIGDALEELARDIYNAPPDPEFPQRQAFYNEGVSPWLEEQARIARKAARA